MLRTPWHTNEGNGIYDNEGKLVARALSAEVAQAIIDGVNGSEVTQEVTGPWQRRESANCHGEIWLERGMDSIGPFTEVYAGRILALLNQAATAEGGG